MGSVFSHAGCLVDTGAIARNFRRLGEPGRLMPVIKSDAYGHGLLPVAKALDKAGAAHFAVGTVAEGVLLRGKGFGQNMLPLLGCVNGEERHLAIEHDLWPLIRGFEDLRQFISLGRPANVALKFDTGMGRLGFAPEDVGALLELLRAAPHIAPRLALSHLACADMPEQAQFTQKQAAVFSGIAETLQNAFPSLAPSLGNSAACLSLPLVGIGRVGISLYGGNPFSGSTQACPDLEWAMSLKAPILQTRLLGKGESVSYGRAWIAPADLRVGIVGAGYANGINRNLSGKMRLLVRGKRVAQIGCICMGMMMIDLSGQPDAQAGDDAWIMGGEPERGETAPTAQELADLLDTIPYEILCLFGSMNGREYAEAV